jgi:hypothetical protein
MNLPGERTFDTRKLAIAEKLSHICLNGFGKNMSPASMAGLTLDVVRCMGFMRQLPAFGGHSCQLEDNALFPYTRL